MTGGGGGAPPSGNRGELSPAGRAPRLGRNVVMLSAVSFLTDVATEMMYPLLPAFLSTVLGANPSFIGAIEGTAESTASLFKVLSGWWSDRVARRKPLVVFGYGVASFVRPLIGIAQSAGQVLAIRVIDRFGKGVRGAPRDALIADSADPSIRGRAFGFHAAADNAGAVVGPLIAFALLHWAGVSLRTIFWLTIVPGLGAMAVLLLGVKDVTGGKGKEVQPVAQNPAGRSDAAGSSPPIGGRFWAYLGAVLLFTLGNSTDAFLLLRAHNLGVPIALAPILWALLNLVKAVLGTHGGALSDRIGRKPLLVAGWVWYALVYFAFARATAAWHAWLLFAAYGVFYALTEGTEKALVADIVPEARRGAAYGWYNVAIGLGALPASIIFGAVWERAGAPVAFSMGAALALAAAVMIAVVAPGRARTA